MWTGVTRELSASGVWASADDTAATLEASFGGCGEVEGSSGCRWEGGRDALELLGGVEERLSELRGPGGGFARVA